MLFSDELHKDTCDLGGKKDVRSLLSPPNAYEPALTLDTRLASSVDLPILSQDTRNEDLLSPEGNPQEEQAPTAGSETGDDSKAVRRFSTLSRVDAKVTKHTLTEAPDTQTPSSEEQGGRNDRGSAFPTNGPLETQTGSGKAEKAIVTDKSDPNEVAESVSCGMKPVNDIALLEHIGQGTDDEGSVGRIAANTVKLSLPCAADRPSLVVPKRQANISLERRDSVVVPGEGSAASTSAEANHSAGELGNVNSPSWRGSIGRALAERSCCDHEDVEVHETTVSKISSA